MVETPKTYPSVIEPAIATFNFTDIAEGTGVVEFLGFKVSTGSATYDYALTTNTSLFSADRGGEELNGFDQRFEVTFNLPKDVKGTAFIKVPIGLHAGTGQRSGFIKATVFHFDGSTETEIGSETQSESFSTGTGFVIFSCVVKIALTETHFEKGDTLRIRIQGTASGGSNGTNSEVFFSPIGSQEGGTGVTGWVGETLTKLSVFIPFRIDI